MSPEIQSFKRVTNGVQKTDRVILAQPLSALDGRMSGPAATIATILAVGRISIKNIGIVHNREYDEGALRIEFYDAESLQSAAALLRHHRYQVWDV